MNNLMRPPSPKKPADTAEKIEPLISFCKLQEVIDYLLSKVKEFDTKVVPIVFYHVEQINRFEKIQENLLSNFEVRKSPPNELPDLSIISKKLQTLQEHELMLKQSEQVNKDIELRTNMLEKVSVELQTDIKKKADQDMLSKIMDSMEMPKGKPIVAGNNNAALKLFLDELSAKVNAISATLEDHTRQIGILPSMDSVTTLNRELVNINNELKNKAEGTEMKKVGSTITKMQKDVDAIKKLNSVKEINEMSIKIKQLEAAFYSSIGGEAKENEVSLVAPINLGLGDQIKIIKEIYDKKFQNIEELLKEYMKKSEFEGIRAQIYLEFDSMSKGLQNAFVNKGEAKKIFENYDESIKTIFELVTQGQPNKEDAILSVKGSTGDIICGSCGSRNSVATAQGSAAQYVSWSKFPLREFEKNQAEPSTKVFALLKPDIIESIKDSPVSTRTLRYEDKMQCQEDKIFNILGSKSPDFSRKIKTVTPQKKRTLTGKAFVKS